MNLNRFSFSKGRNVNSREKRFYEKRMELIGAEELLALKCYNDEHARQS